MKNEFTLAFNEVLEDKGLPREIILEALESAMVSAYRKSVNASTEQQIEATVDMETGKVTVFAQKEVVESVENEITEVELSVARQVDPEAQLGDLVTVESTPSDFGRVAAQTARQVIQQRIRDAERKAAQGPGDILRKTTRRDRQRHRASGERLRSDHWSRTEN